MIINEFRFFEGRYQGKQYNSNFGAVFFEYNDKFRYLSAQGQHDESDSKFLSCAIILQ